MNYLDILLQSIGYEHRAPQDRLYEALIQTNQRGVVAQAGTGVGKSIAVIAAAAYMAAKTELPSVIVTPTRILMDQYMATDVPAAAKAFGMKFQEIRGKAHYECQLSKQRADILGDEYYGGCWGKDSGCTMAEWRGTTASMMHDGWSEDDAQYGCGYQQAKHRAGLADVVVTNTDMWLINDRMLAPLDAEFFSPFGAVLVDEAHQLPAKMAEYAGKSLSARYLKHFKPAREAGKELAAWAERQANGRLLQESTNFPIKALLAVAEAKVDDSDGERAGQVKEAAVAIVHRMKNQHDACVLHVTDQSIKLDWTTVAAAAGETLSARPFALVSATVPRSMPRVLGVPNAHYVNVGHPFDYGKQATISISAVDGSYKNAKTSFKPRANDVYNAVAASKGGALLLANSNRDTEFLFDYFKKRFRAMGLETRRQGGDYTNEELTEWFKSGENNVLIGTESFKQGVDFQGRALRLVVLWAVPFPSIGNPVMKKIADTDHARYRDLMKTSAAQACGRLIRSDTDVGHILIADSRGEQLIDARDPLLSHLAEMRRV